MHIQLAQFEGPLGLLLHLIRKEEMDIFDINIHQVTRQYMEYIRAMKKLDLEMAGEFVAMAATLIHIKSRMLLPQYDEDGEEIVEDPRRDLVQRLLEYQKFQDASKQLYDRPLLGRDVWLRGKVEELEVVDTGEVLVAENALFALISSYRTAIRSMRKSVHRVLGELQSVASRIVEIRQYFRVGEKLKFRQMITASDGVSDQVLVTFLSVLELTKMGFLKLFQSETYGDIYIEPKKVVGTDVISQVEEYAHVDQAMDLDTNLDLEWSESPDEIGQLSLQVNDSSLSPAASNEDILAEEIRLELVEPTSETAEDIQTEGSGNGEAELL